MSSITVTKMKTMAAERGGGAAGAVMENEASTALRRNAYRHRRPSDVPPKGMDAITRERSALIDELRGDPRLAIRAEEIICLICGAAFRQLTNTHLRSHAITAPEYKQRFGYNRRRALMCAALQRRYADRAVGGALASKIRRRPILDDPTLRVRGSARPISLEERLNRREARRRRGVR